MKHLIVAAALAATLASAVPAAADDWHGKRLNVPRDQWLAPTQMIEKLTAQGYRVHEIESDDGAYEVEMSKNGTRIEAHVHPATGEILLGYDD